MRRAIFGELISEFLNLKTEPNSQKRIHKLLFEVKLPFGKFDLFNEFATMNIFCILFPQFYWYQFRWI